MALNPTQQLRLSGTAACACPNAVPFLTDSLCAARGRHRRAGGRSGWGRAGDSCSAPWDASV